MSAISKIAADSHIDLELIIDDAVVISYLNRFADEEVQKEKALEALAVGVIAIQSASPTLDTEIVQEKFRDLETKMGSQMADFQEQMSEVFGSYFEEDNGLLPRSIDGIFGSEGKLTRTFSEFFDPAKGRVSELMKTQIGPESPFGKAVDPENKRSLVSLIEASVAEQVEEQLGQLTDEFSFDDEESAISKLKAMLNGFFNQLNESLGIQSAVKEEAERGHVKGMIFEQDLYEVFADLGRQLGDETEFVHGTPGTIARKKTGDFVATLGDASGSPGMRICVEVKDKSGVKLKDAIAELQEAKENRQAAVGLFVFSRGTQPKEVGDFRKIGEDFFVTVDKDDLAADDRLLFFDAAYRIVRALAVAADRKRSADEFDLQKIEDEIEAIGLWSDRIAEMIKKARTVQSSGKLIEETAREMKEDMDGRLEAIHEMFSKNRD